MALDLSLARLSPAARRALLVHLLQWQGVQVGSLYVSVYLFRLGHGYQLPAWQALWSYLGVPLGYWIAANLSRRYGAGTSLRLGLAAYALYQALILLLQAGAAPWLVPLGLLWGLGVGLYWQAWVLLVVDLSQEGRDRDLMLGANQASFFVASLTGAPLAGWYLARQGGTRGYPLVFGTALALFLAAWVVSLPLRGSRQHGHSALRRLLCARKPEGWNAGIVSAVLSGILSVGTQFLPALLSMDRGGSESDSGITTAVMAVCGLAAAALVGALGQPERRRRFMLWSALAVAALTLPLAFVRSYPMVLVYSLGMATSMSLFSVPMFGAQIRIVESNPHFLHRRADAMLLREIPLNVGRMLACAVLLWGVGGLSSPAFTGLLAVLAFTPLLNYRLIRPYLGRA